jgi:hypothetical protein
MANKSQDTDYSGYYYSKKMGVIHFVKSSPDESIEKKKGFYYYSIFCGYMLPLDYLLRIAASKTPVTNTTLTDEANYLTQDHILTNDLLKIIAINRKGEPIYADSQNINDGRMYKIL